MAVGLPLKTTYANGDVYSASDVNDTNGTVNLIGQTTNFFAGKNKIINGDFGVWQRGTSFTSAGYCADRFVANIGSVTSPSFSRSTFTPGTAPVSGYEGTFFMTMSGTLSDAVNGYYQLDQRIEDVRTFAGQTVTLSFWAKGSATGTISANISQIFGTGGSANVTVNATNFNITTSWARYTTTLTYPSISGKTIGTGSYARITISKLQGTATGNQAIWGAATFTGTLDVWGVQLEAGSTATAFQTATGTLQGELAACQRYYYKLTNGVANAALMSAFYFSSSSINAYVPFPVTMRTSPTIDQVTGTNYYSFVRNGGTDTFNSFTLDQANATGVAIYNNSEASGTAGQAGYVFANNASAYLAFTSEL
jgi:hypothetical protein